METPQLIELRRQKPKKALDPLLIIAQVTAFGETRRLEVRAWCENELSVPQFAGYVGETGTKLWPMEAKFKLIEGAWVYRGFKPIRGVRARNSGKPRLICWADKAKPGLRAETTWKIEYEG